MFREPPLRGSRPVPYLSFDNAKTSDPGFPEQHNSADRKMVTHLVVDEEFLPGLRPAWRFPRFVGRFCDGTTVATAIS